MSFLRRRRKVHGGYRAPAPQAQANARQHGSQSSPSARKFSRQRLVDRWNRAVFCAIPLPTRDKESPAKSKAPKTKNKDVDENPSFPESPVVFRCKCMVGGDVSTIEMPADVDECCEESLLCAWSENEDQTSFCSKIHGLASIRERLDRRSRLLACLTVQKSEAYRDMITSRHIEVKRLSLEAHVQSVDDVNGSDGHGITLTSILDAVKNHVFFEVHHSLEGLWNIVWYSLGHLAFYMGLDATAKLVRVYLQMSEVAFHATMLAVAIMIMRMNGYIWQWLGRNSYRLVKFDLHNRQILRIWDASLLRIIHRDYAEINEFISILAYYLVCISIAYFYNKVWAAYEFFISAGYSRMEVMWTNRLEKAGLSFDTCDACLEAQCRGVECSSFFGYILEFFLSHTMNYLCQQFSDPGLPMLSIAFHLLLCILSLAAMGIFDLRLFEA